jgi:hypothetical protein
MRAFAESVKSLRLNSEAAAMPKIYENIAVTLDRADENVKAILLEYKKLLSAKTVSAEAADLTHEICTQLRSALDRIAYRCWSTHVAPTLDGKEAKRAKVYFPAADSQESFNSTAGGWRLKRESHPEVWDYLIEQQPFTARKNKWLGVLFDLAVQGKHIDLVPQIRVEQPRVIVETRRPQVSTQANEPQYSIQASWDPRSVRFGGGAGASVRVGGALMNPRTQRIVPTLGVTERIETWVRFIIEGYDVNPAIFVKVAAIQTRRIVQEMTDRFGLS